MYANINAGPQANFLQKSAKAKLPASKAFWHGVKDAGTGNLLGLPFIALEVGSAQRGEQVPILMGRGAGLMTYPAMTGIMAAGATMVAETLGFAIPAVGIFASLAALYPDSCVQNTIIRSVKVLNATARQVNHLEFGGSYQDSETAQSMRLRGLQEMSGAIGNSRGFLGQEAAFMHR